MLVLKLSKIHVASLMKKSDHEVLSDSTNVLEACSPPYSTHQFCSLLRLCSWSSCCEWCCHFWCETHNYRVYYGSQSKLWKQWRGPFGIDQAGFPKPHCVHLFSGSLRFQMDNEKDLRTAVSNCSFLVLAATYVDKMGELSAAGWGWLSRCHWAFWTTLLRVWFSRSFLRSLPWIFSWIIFSEWFLLRSVYCWIAASLLGFRMAISIIVAMMWSCPSCEFEWTW